MKKHFVVLMVNLIFITTCIGQKMVLKLAHNKTNYTIEYLDPFMYELTFLNTNDTLLEYEEPWNKLLRPYLEVQKYDDKEGAWSELIYSNYQPDRFFCPPHEGWCYSRSKKLYPGGYSQKATFFWAFFPKHYYKTEPNPLMPGKYRVRAKLKTDDYFLVSDTCNLTVKPLKRRDKIMYDSLSFFPMPTFFYQFILCEHQWGRGPSSGFEADDFSTTYTEKLVKQFPKAKFTKWIKLHLILLYTVRSSPVKNELKAKAILNSITPKELKDNIFNKYYNVMLKSELYDPNFYDPKFD
jgi:hypothetical protein